MLLDACRNGPLSFPGDKSLRGQRVRPPRVLVSTPDAREQAKHYVVSKIGWYGRHLPAGARHQIVVDVRGQQGVANGDAVLTRLRGLGFELFDLYNGFVIDDANLGQVRSQFMG